MLKIRKNFGVLLVCFSLIVFSGCGTKQKKDDGGNASTVNTEALAQFQKEQKELLEKANAELSAINRKIIACNDKIHEKGGKLTDAQNKALDDFEKQRASINQRIHQIKNVNMADWNSFKSKFETDLNEASSNIEKIMTEL